MEMTSKEMEDYLNLKLRIEFMNIVKRIGVETGSYNFGLDHGGSDRDYVITNHEFSTYKHNTIILNCNSSSDYIDEDDVNPFTNYKLVITEHQPTIDLIVVPTLADKEAWRITTEKFKLMMRQSDEFYNLVHTKNIRVKMFGAMCSKITSVIKESDYDNSEPQIEFHNYYQFYAPMKAKIDEVKKEEKRIEEEKKLEEELLRKDEFERQRIEEALDEINSPIDEPEVAHFEDNNVHNGILSGLMLNNDWRNSFVTSASSPISIIGSSDTSDLYVTQIPDRSGNNFTAYYNLDLNGRPIINTNS